MMKTLIGAALSAVAIIAAAVETELWKPGGEPFAVNEFRDGVLHLKDDTGGRSNNRLYRRFTGKELTPYRGRRVVFSARIRQLAASRANSVGLTLDVKARDGRTVYRSARIPVRGVTEWMPYSVTADIPPDAAAFGASLDCANGYGGTADTRSGVPAPEKRIALQTDQLTGSGRSWTKRDWRSLRRDGLYWLRPTASRYCWPVPRRIGRN